MADHAGSAAHWDAAYLSGENTQSWYENYPGMSIRMLESAEVTLADSVIDVGGGASPLAEALLDRGFQDLTVLDISASGLQVARARLGHRSEQIHWLSSDILSWQPQRQYGVWHDRAVFHFLTVDGDRAQYIHILDIATAPGAVAVFGAFAEDGPMRCSGLPVARYSATELAREVGRKWTLIRGDRELHVTPAGAVQPFSWVALRKQA
jgi:hypothetical protein